MGNRGAKPKFTDVSCPNKNCKLYGISGQGYIWEIEILGVESNESIPKVIHQLARIIDPG
jgi:hypothetical protein